jgi:uncharacterized membrane protein
VLLFVAAVVLANTAAFLERQVTLPALIALLALLPHFLRPLYAQTAQLEHLAHHWVQPPVQTALLEDSAQPLAPRVTLRARHVLRGSLVPLLVHLTASIVLWEGALTLF